MEDTERPLLGEDEGIELGAEVVLALYDTHCTTADCPNGAFTIRVPASPVSPLVTCGGCGVPISDCTLIE